MATRQLPAITGRVREQRAGFQQALAGTRTGSEQPPLAVLARGRGRGQAGKGFVALLRPYRQQVDAQQAFATESQAEQYVLFDIPRVVVDHFHGGSGHDPGCAVGEIALETAAAQQPRLPPVGSEQHERPGLGVRGAFGKRDHCHTADATGGTQGGEEGQYVRPQKGRTTGSGRAQSGGHGEVRWQAMREV